MRRLFKKQQGVGKRSLRAFSVHNRVFEWNIDTDFQFEIFGVCGRSKKVTEVEPFFVQSATKFGQCTVIIKLRSNFERCLLDFVQTIL